MQDMLNENSEVETKVDAKEVEIKRNKIFKIFRFKLKGENRFETAENYCIAGAIIGTIVLSVGILFTIVSTKGIIVVATMLGTLLSFCSVVALVFVWLIKDLFGR